MPGASFRAHGANSPSDSNPPACSPGKLQRYIPGISKKILTERLRKLVDFDVLKREEITSESMPHVEYHLTAKGRKLASVLRLIRELNE